MKKIGIDLDGVVFDSENLYRVYTEIYDVDVKKGDNLIDNTKRLFQDRYNWTKEEANELYNNIYQEILTNANLMEGADIVLNKLKNEFELIVVTSRNDVGANIARTKFNGMGLNITIFNNEHDKIDKFLEEKVDYIIDDDEDICSNAADQGIKALYFKNNASNKVDHNNVINVNNWGEIYKYLMLYR